MLSRSGSSSESEIVSLGLADPVPPLAPSPPPLYGSTPPETEGNGTDGSAVDTEGPDVQDGDGSGVGSAGEQHTEPEGEKEEHSADGEKRPPSTLHDEIEQYLSQRRATLPAGGEGREGESQRKLGNSSVASAVAWEVWGLT